MATEKSKMNVTKCLNGHFYDGDKYDVCPHCGAAPIDDSQPAEELSDTVQKKKKIKVPWGRKKKDEQKAEVIIVPMPDKTVGKTIGRFDEEIDEFPAEADSQFTADPETPSENDTSDTGHGCTSDDGKKEELPFMAYDSACTEIESDQSGESGSGSFREAVRQVAASGEGKTVGYFSSGDEIPSYTDPLREPVVGWLVCVKGAHYGQSFQISAGQNSIGRSSNNRIILSHDQSVSRDKHAWITYEPRKREFFIQQGEGSGLTYLNNDAVLGVKKLIAMDRLEFGKGVYLLVPLCGPDFTWEDYMNRE